MPEPVEPETEAFAPPIIPEPAECVDEPQPPKTKTAKTVASTTDRRRDEEPTIVSVHQRSRDPCRGEGPLARFIGRVLRDWYPANPHRRGHSPPGRAVGAQQARNFLLTPPSFLMLNVTGWGSVYMDSDISFGIRDARFTASFDTGLRRRRNRDVAQPTAGSAGECLGREMDRHRPPRVPGPSAGLQRTTSGARPCRVCEPLQRAPATSPYTSDHQWLGSNPEKSRVRAIPISSEPTCSAT